MWYNINVSCIKPKLLAGKPLENVQLQGGEILQTIFPHVIAVSYTHLDVYKRQILHIANIMLTDCGSPAINFFYRHTVGQSKAFFPCIAALLL